MSKIAIFAEVHASTQFSPKSSGFRISTKSIQKSSPRIANHFTFFRQKWKNLPRYMPPTHFRRNRRIFWFRWTRYRNDPRESLIIWHFFVKIDKFAEVHASDPFSLKSPNFLISMKSIQRIPAIRWSFCIFSSKIGNFAEDHASDPFSSQNRSKFHRFDQ